MSVLASFGMSKLMGAKSTSVNGSLFFLACGIGVDDSFVFLDVLRRTMGSTLLERFSEAMAIGGHAMLVTFFTDAAAFSMGLFSATPTVDFTFVVNITVVPACNAWVLGSNKHHEGEERRGAKHEGGARGAKDEPILTSRAPPPSRPDRSFVARSMWRRQR